MRQFFHSPTVSQYPVITVIIIFGFRTKTCNGVVRRNKSKPILCNYFTSASRSAMLTHVHQGRIFRSNFTGLPHSFTLHHCCQSETDEDESEPEHGGVTLCCLSRASHGNILEVATIRHGSSTKQVDSGFKVQRRFIGHRE